MIEQRKMRISRLNARKAELLGDMKALRANSARNAEHKINMLNEQVMRIGERIIKLKGK